MNIETLISRLGELTRDAVHIIGADARDASNPVILWCNPAFCALTGYTAEEVVGQSPQILFGAGAEDAPMCRLTGAMQGGREAREEISILHKDGTIVWTEVDLHPADHGDEGAYWIVFQRSLESSGGQEAAGDGVWDALNALPDAFALYDTGDRLVRANDAFLSLHQANGAEITPGMTLEEIIRLGLAEGVWERGGGDPGVSAEDVLKRRRGGDEISGMFRTSTGRWLQATDRRLPNGGRVGLWTDVTDLKLPQDDDEDSDSISERKRVQIERRALSDELTGLLNRRGLEVELGRRLGETREARLAVILVNLDRFKQINDTLGYEAGDHVLRAVVKTLRPLIGDDDTFARSSGNEFAIVREVGRDDQTTKDLGRQILRAVAQPILYQDRPCRISACIGVAYERDETKTVSELLLDADVALHRAQEQGRGHLEIFSREITLELEEKKRLADEVSEALENEAFFPIYQPQFDTHTLEIVGVEALARWQHPTRGILAPNTFLKIAEEMNVLSEIDRQIFERSVADMRRLERKGIEVPRLSVNISLKRLCDPDLMRSIDRLDTSGLEIAFELLETIFLDDQNEDYDWSIDQLQERGIDIEIDDFGSGRASIVGLTRVRPKRMKIDRQLVIPILDSESRRDLLAALVDIGRSLGIGVTAEGVETMRHIEHLRDMGCDTVQGFGLARPMPFTDLQRVLMTTERNLNIEA
ncbi:MAG: EAL domain-containing protein [Pseudomonadota bacterium]